VQRVPDARWPAAGGRNFPGLRELKSCLHDSVRFNDGVVFMRAIGLWLLGVPIWIIILLAIFTNWV
jgi:hypothetical protein